jgi:hypothetical protein
MADILREYKPGLALIHFTAYDALCHKHGRGSDALTAAYEALDRNLARILNAAVGDMDVILFSDHNQLNVHTIINPNDVLMEKGLIRRFNGEYTPGDSGCYVECCGGSAFFHAGTLPPERVDEIRGAFEEIAGFRRFLTDDEMRESGYADSDTDAYADADADAGADADAAFGFCAEAGYLFETYPGGEKANHGYPLDMPDYDVFYAVKLRDNADVPGNANRSGIKRGNVTCSDITHGSVTRGGSLLDIAPLAARRLNISI